MRHIDHVVVAVRELDQAADVYRRLGFQVGARNRHPWGTENRLIQFGSSFIELITAARGVPMAAPHQERHFSFGEFVRDYLREREGIAMLVLSSGDARADASRFAEQGIGDFEPFSFARKAKRSDDSVTDVAFTLAFANDPAAPDAGFFVCQQHFPENFWNGSFQQHANSAKDIAGVTLTTADPKRHAEFLTKFTGEAAESLTNGGLKFALDRGRIEVAPAVGAQTKSLSSPLLISVSIRIDEFHTLESLLKTEGIPFNGSDEGIDLSARSLFGVGLRFESNAGRPDRGSNRG